MDLRTARAQLRKWRGKRPLWDAANDLGCDASYVAYLEKGKRLPDLPTAVAIERHVGIPVATWEEAARRAAKKKKRARPPAPDAQANGAAA